MARTVEEILKSQLGNLLVEVAVLTAKLEAAQAELVKLGKAAAAEDTKQYVSTLSLQRCALALGWYPAQHTGSNPSDAAESALVA